MSGTQLTAHKAMMAITMKIIATPTATMIGQNSQGAVTADTSGFSSKVSCDKGTTSTRLVHSASYYIHTLMEPLLAEGSSLVNRPLPKEKKVDSTTAFLFNK